MAHSLHQMTEDDTQWEELMRSMVEAFENPMQSMFRLFRPVLEPGPQADEASYQEFKHRMQFEYGADGIWQKVINQDGKLVGGALWKIFYQNPFAKHQDETVYWYPEGGARDFASGALELFEGPRRKWGTRPQVFLNILWAHPDCQRNGIGKLIMDWGVKRAVELDFEMWLDASPYGKGLYEQFGFTTVEQLNMTPQQDPPNEAWAKLKSELGEMMSEAMWKPSESQCKRSAKGKDMKPWDLEKTD